MELFEKIFFSSPLFQLFTIYTKISILDVWLCSEYSSGAVNYFCKRLHLDVWMGSRFASDMIEERQKLEKTCKWVIFRKVAANSKKWFLRNFWEKLYWEMVFFTVIFSKFCKKVSSHWKCSIKKTILKNFCNIHKKTPMLENLLIMLQAWRKYFY